MTSPWVIGMDGGGTRCRARLLHLASGRTLDVETGPANPASNATRAYASVLDACTTLQQQSGLPESEFVRIPAVLGLAGLNVADSEARVSHWQLPLHQVQFTTDLHIACAGAHRARHGAIVITGTGSSACCISDQGIKIWGGHGFVLGDDASGAWLGRQALRHTLQTLEGMQPANALCESVVSQLGSDLPAQLVATSLAFEPTEFAALAPSVFNCAAAQDPAACALLREGAAYLDAVIAQLYQQPLRIAMLGGLAQAWQPWLAPVSRQCLSDALASPLEGATLLAQHLLDDSRV